MTWVYLRVHAGWQWRRFKEWFWSGLAWKLPRPLAYWATIRVGAHATTGKYSGEDVPSVSFIDCLQRWNEK